MWSDAACSACVLLTMRTRQMIDPLCSMPGSAGNQYGISFSLIWEWRFGIWSTPATLRKNSTTRHIEFPTVWIAPRNTQFKTHSLLFPQMRHVHKSDFYYRRVLRFTSNAFTRTRTTTWHSASARTADNQAMNARSTQARYRLGLLRRFHAAAPILQRSRPPVDWH